MAKPQDQIELKIEKIDIPQKNKGALDKKNHKK